MAFDPLLVLKGEIKIGATSGTATSYKAEVTSVVLKKSRDTVEIPATLGTGRKDRKAGAVMNEITINVIGDVQATSLWAALWAAMDTDSGEQYFECLLKDGAVGALNPKFSGQMVVTEASIGAASGTLSQFSVTMPINGDITKAIV